MQTATDIQASEEFLILDGVKFDKSKLTERELKRIELEIAVAEFKAAGKEIRVLKQGETDYPDGILPPPSRHRVTETPSEKIIERNKLISASKEKSSTPPKKRVYPRKFSDEELARRNDIIAKARAAKANGETSFIATCKHHGLTTYLIICENSKCELCVNGLKDRTNANAVFDQEELARRKTISARREKAELEGKTEFFGPCRIHKETLYKIQTNGARCHLCCLNRGRKSRSNVKTSEQIADTLRKKNNKVKLKEAIEKGLKEYEADCLHCGSTPFRIKTIKKGTPNEKNYSYCIECNRKRHRLSP